MWLFKLICVSFLSYADFFLNSFRNTISIKQIGSRSDPTFAGLEKSMCPNAMLSKVQLGWFFTNPHTSGEGILAHCNATLCSAQVSAAGRIFAAVIPQQPHRGSTFLHVWPCVPYGDKTACHVMSEWLTAIKFLICNKVSYMQKINTIYYINLLFSVFFYLLIKNPWSGISLPISGIQCLHCYIWNLLILINQSLYSEG